MNLTSPTRYTQPSVRVGPLICIPEILEELGTDPAPIFGELGFDLSHFADPDNEIPYIRGSKLIKHCVDTTGREDFGLLMARKCKPSSLGIAGFILRVAPDVNTALTGLQRHLILHDRWAEPLVETRGENTRLSYRINLAGVHNMDQILDLSMAMACKILSSLCGPEWRATEVLLARPKPKDELPYRQWFQAPLIYGVDLSAMVFPSYWLDKKLKDADPLLLEFLEKQAAKMHARLPQDLLVELRNFMRVALATGYCTASTAAEHLGMHERTLNRELIKVGTNFRRELEDVRYETACKMLADSNTNLARIATALGYSDSTAFIRAFKRWSKSSPEQWRSEICSQEALLGPDC